MKKFKKLDRIEWITVICLILAPIVIAMLLPIINFDNGSDDGWLGFWGGYLGAVISIFAVFYQIRKQKEKFDKNNSIDFLIIATPKKRDVNKKDVNKGRNTTEQRLDWAFSVYNIGNKAGSIKFLGFCTKDDFRKLKKGEEDESVISTPTIPSSSGKFLRVDYGEVSEDIWMDKSSMNKLYGEGKKLLVVFQDPLGKYYTQEIVV
ncbi:hypothetical protein NYZ94_08430 [Ligilactobacillus salivarius]|nr:hypothetical protein NYZ94_08430 [Ligilactobacillus salivarius]